MKNYTFLLAAALLCTFHLAAQTSIIPFGSTWKYLDNGTDQGTAWRSPSFNDDHWKSGPSELGYGDNDEATVVSYGGDDDYKYITTYFRKALTLTDAAQAGSYTLSIKADDGAVVYVNGREAARVNIPTGTVSYQTLANYTGKDGNSQTVITIDASAFSSGTNLIAVEVHQCNSWSSDISFDLSLSGPASLSPPPPDPTPEPTPNPEPEPPPGPDPGSVPVYESSEVTRGPYLQMASQSAITIRWRTKEATDSKVELGTVYGLYPIVAHEPDETTEHEVRIGGLAAGTRYYYRIGTSREVLQASAANYFSTAPPASASRKIRVAAFGDCGLRGDTQTRVLKAYLNHLGSAPGDLMLLLGDNAYDDGTDAEFQDGFFEPYGGTVLKNHVLFPTPGNHDYRTTSVSSRSAPYYKIFTMPTEGECGGVASGTEAFYSYDWGNIHFISMDSYGTEEDDTHIYDTLGPQVRWLKKDLEANTKPWTVVYWHHPPYTMGTYNSDTREELTAIRKNLLRILERYGVDLVMCDHSHVYERSYLLRGYYGTESSFNPSTHTASSSSGKYNGSSNSCPYVTTTTKTNHGTVYVVSGTASKDNSTVRSSFPHAALPFATRDGGVFYFEVEGNRLDAKFIHKNGTVYDQFTILKDVDREQTLSVAAGVPVTLTASWIGEYKWSNGATSQSITVTPGSSTTYTVRDDKNCLADEFNVRVTDVTANRRAGAERQISEETATSLQVFPTVVEQGSTVTLRASSPEITEAIVVDNTGHFVRALKFTGTHYLNTRNLAGGTYYIQLTQKGKIYRQKVIVLN